MSSFYIPTLRPAEVTIPRHVQKVVVANRAFPDKGWNTVGNIVEGVLTGEGIMQDREGARNAILGFVDATTKSPRFQVAQSNKLLKGTGMAHFPQPLSWQEVEQICSEVNADALIVLEVFDSNVFSSGKVDTVLEIVKNKEGKQDTIKKPVYSMAQKVDVTTGWRVYDPKQRSIADEFRTMQTFNYNKSGASPVQTAIGGPDQRGVVDRSGFVAGGGYSARISPSWTTISRSFYGRGAGDKRLKIAGRKAKGGDWDGAVGLWQGILQNGNTKAKKRASYNMILAAEKEGKLSLALDWAIKSASDYNCRPARSYGNMIRSRMASNSKLREQMGDEY